MKYLPNKTEHLMWPSGRPGMPVQALPRVVRSGPDRRADLPVHRSILALDIEGSTSALRTNPIRRELRGELYRMLELALARTGIGTDQCDPFEDRGDGVVALIHPEDEIPKAYLLSRLIPDLARLLAERNQSLPVAERSCRGMRLRAVVHAGEVHRDSRGYFGEALDLACRLLDAAQLKKRLKAVAEPLALVVSEDIYWSIVQHEYEGIRAEMFRPEVRVRITGRSSQGWVHVPVTSARVDGNAR